ncbi:MAG: SdrD B-like domain-containing protein [Eubacteriales bacterium]|nr:SdrD B-like domain-containing protein [Eubacteriales bacterium]
MNHSPARKTLLIALLMTVLALLPAAAENTGSLSGYAFVDSNLDGLYDGNERLSEGVEISLVKVDGASGTVVGTALTQADGAYQFTQLAPGEYYLTASLPRNLQFSPYNASGSVMLPASGRASRSLPFLLEGGSMDKHIGVTAKSAYINVVAFGDENANGGRFSSEPLLRDVLIEVLFEAGGQSHVIASGTTDKEGFLRIPDLTPGTYRIAATMPDPYIIGPRGEKVSAFYNVVNPSDSNRGESDPFTLSGSIGLGVGGVKSGSLKGITWFDSNMNGLRDADEPGASGLILTLTSLDFGVIRTLTADSQTAYEFAQLQAGSYVLSATVPDGQMFTLPGGDSLFTDGYKSQQDTPLTVAEGVASQVEPIGVMPSTSLEVIAFHDSNYNGVLDEGELPFAGAGIEVLDAGQVAASAQTDARGLALIPRIRGESSQVRGTLPVGQVFTVPGGEDGNAFTSVTAESDITIVAAAPHGQKTTLYAGVTLPAVIAGTLFEDHNTSGVLDTQEAGLPGFTVRAIDREGNVAAETNTDKAGAYELQPLLPGEYRVRVMLQSPYIFSNTSHTGTGIENKIVAQTPEYGETEAAMAAPGQRVEGMDAGAFRSGVVYGRVLLGDDREGFGGTIGGLAGVLVELMDENDDPVSDFTLAATDESGAFSLKGALPGTYKLRFTLPRGAKFSRPMMEETAWLTEPFDITAGEERPADVVFAVKTGIFSGSAFNDVNFNGIFDAGDSNLPGVRVVIRSDARTVYEVLSGEDGTFALTGIRPGAYTLEVTVPEGLAIGSGENSPVVPAITGYAIQALDLSMGEVRDINLIAAVSPLQVAGTAFYDNDLSGIFSPETDTPYAARAAIRHLATGAEYVLEPARDGSFSLAAAFPGEYELTVELPGDHLLTLPAAASQSGGAWSARVTLAPENPRLDLGFVQYGSLQGAVWNMDGSLSGVGALEITLLDSQGNALATAITGEDGGFLFEKLYPGQYALGLTLPENHRFARAMDTVERVSVITSDTEDTPGGSSAISLTMGEKKAAQDIGIGAMGKLGDFAWLDLNANGMQDAGEPGVPDIGIALYQYGELITQATTDIYGRYLIDGLFPGTYTVVVSVPPELKPTLIQTEFPLVASVLAAGEGATGRVDKVLVPSGGRNLNCDFGFVLVTPGRYPASMENLPTRDWSPVVDVVPMR